MRRRTGELSSRNENFSSSSSIILLEWFPTRQHKKVLNSLFILLNKLWVNSSYFSNSSTHCVFFFFSFQFQSRNQNTTSRCVAKEGEINGMAFELHCGTTLGSVWTTSNGEQSHQELPSEESHHRRNAKCSRRDKHIQARAECDKGTSR